MALWFTLVAMLLLASVAYAGQVEGEVVLPMRSKHDLDLRRIQIVEAPAGVSDQYCCLRNAFGCVQECDSNKKYNCCLKNAFGCQQLCEEGKNVYCCLKNGLGSCLQKCEEGYEYYCCKKNRLGICIGLCPKLNQTSIENLIQEVV